MSTGPNQAKELKSVPQGLSDSLERNKGANPSWPPAVVASVFQTGLNLMRDLEQKGINVIGVDCNPDNPGFTSKFGRSLLCPNPDQDSDGWLAFMLSLSSAIGQKPVLIPASDIFVSAIGRHAKTLEGSFIFSTEGANLQASLATKETQYALAKKYRFPSPQAAYIQSQSDLEEFANGARFPVLLKPLHQREWQALPPSNPLRLHKTVSAHTKSELLDFYAQVSALVPEAVAQEEIVGPDSAKYCYLSVYATDGHRLGSCVVHEMRAYPLLYGCATMVEPIVDEEIDRICNDFLTSLGYIGICEIEVKRDARDGRVLLIEVNPRYSGTGDCARYVGVEIGFIHYLDLIGQTPPPAVASRFDFRHVMLCADIAAFPKYREQKLIGWKEWLTSYRGSIKFFDLDTSDPSNARRTTWKAVRAFFGGFLGRGSH